MLNRTFSARASFTIPTSSSGGTMAFGTCFDGYTVQIHAQPYNYHKLTQTDNGNGTISFTYDWNSTSGLKSDLTDCHIHERVAYPGTSNPYFAPAPFSQAVNYPNPTVKPTMDSSGNSMTTGIGNDTHDVWAAVKPYLANSVTAAQRYEFNDTATGEKNVLIPGPDSTASIVRSVTNSRPLYPADIWWYSVVKQGKEAWLQLP